MQTLRCVFLFCLCCVVGVGAATTARADPVEDISRWLQCEDCGPDALAAVVALGDRATALLAQSAVTGPAPARIEAMRMHLTGLYVTRQASGRVEPSSGGAATAAASLRATVDRYLRSKVELEQVRALQALAAIGSDASRAALGGIAEAVRDGRLGPIATREWSRLTAGTLADSVLNDAASASRDRARWHASPVKRSGASGRAQGEQR